MKNLLYLGIILMLASCGSNESTVNVNGREVSTVKIGNLEVMTEDLGEEGDITRLSEEGVEFNEPMRLMDWYEAMKACADLGDGWRLPTKDELNVLYENKDKIGGFAGSKYWSSTEHDNDYAWAQNFIKGGQYSKYKNNDSSVRAVRAF